MENKVTNDQDNPELSEPEGVEEQEPEQEQLIQEPSPETRIEELEQQVADAKDQALRAVADAQNQRRRAEKDVESAHKYALEKFAGELLAVVDNLDRALQAADLDHEAVKPLAEGVELTHKSLIDVLNKFKVVQIDPVGEPFDPQLHQAMAMIESPDAEPNTVIDVMQKGYELNGRLIRPAMVVVSKA
jgi:molecular chaperone GrpE